MRYDMLEAFLPFQLEYAFSSAMLLSILGTILPAFVRDSTWPRTVRFVLQEMIRKKNAVQLAGVLIVVRHMGYFTSVDQELSSSRC